MTDVIQTYDVTPYGHSMLPNESHPGPGCSCRECLSAYPDRQDCGSAAAVGEGAEAKAECTPEGASATGAKPPISIPAEWLAHPDFGTPNWCSKCTPAGLGYCRCEIACNE